MVKKDKAPHLIKGDDSEQIAHDYLISQGLKPILRNYRCRFGEIDLIMDDNKTVAMVEVRYRKTDKFGSALESVTRHKQARLIAAAGHYLVAKKIDKPVRFDVIAVSPSGSINWIRNAFQASF